MANLIEQLRSLGPDWSSKYNAGKLIPYKVCADAADEIERLLAALKEMIDAFEDEEMDYEVKEAAMKKARAAIVNQQKAVEK